MTIYRYIPMDLPNDCLHMPYVNANFDIILRHLGKYYFRNPNLTINQICSKLRDEMNSEWHLNKLRPSIQRKRITTMQIKSIRRSYNKDILGSNQFVRIPFDIVPIVFYIMSLLRHCSEESSSVRLLIEEMNRQTVSQFIYSMHTNSLRYGYARFMQTIGDPELRYQCERLRSHLLHYNAVMHGNFASIPWNQVVEYRNMIGGR